MILENNSVNFIIDLVEFSVPQGILYKKGSNITLNQLRNVDKETINI